MYRTEEFRLPFIVPYVACLPVKRMWLDDGIIKYGEPWLSSHRRTMKYPQEISPKENRFKAVRRQREEDHERAILISLRSLALTAFLPHKPRKSFMDTELKCNRLTCRKALTDKAVVVSLLCSTPPDESFN